MKLYQTPHGTWAGSEANWKTAMKAEGSDPKTATRKIVEVPVDKAGLLEFLTFHNVNVINPGAPVSAPEVTGGATPQPPAPPVATTMSLDEQFYNAPMAARLRLAVTAIDAADALIATLTAQK